jgi:hypothetical protein
MRNAYLAEKICLTPCVLLLTGCVFNSKSAAIGNAAKKIISMIEDSGEQIEEGEGEQAPAPLAIPA